MINSGGSNGIPNNYSATKLSTGGSRSQTMCVITTEKRAYCWGQAKFGQLGVGPVAGDNYSRATRVKGLEDVDDISQDGYWWTKDPDYVTHTSPMRAGYTVGVALDVDRLDLWGVVLLKSILSRGWSMVCLGWLCRLRLVFLILAL